MSTEHSSRPCCHCAHHPKPAVERPAIDPLAANRREFLATA
ncbi:MAG: hypothetical protein H6Q10_3441, partial [Acidobacteria bacterium]|nr:hypothetical protein [Acidobacteriota bacterium]